MTAFQLLHRCETINNHVSNIQKHIRERLQETKPINKKILQREFDAIVEAASEVGYDTIETRQPKS